MERKTVRERFAEFLTECRFGWQVLARDDRTFLIWMITISATASVFASVVGSTIVLEVTIGFLIFSIAIAITDAWRTGHHILRQADPTAQRPNR